MYYNSVTFHRLVIRLLRPWGDYWLSLLGNPSLCIFHICTPYVCYSKSLGRLMHYFFDHLSLHKALFYASTIIYTAEGLYSKWPLDMFQCWVSYWEQTLCTTTYFLEFTDTWRCRRGVGLCNSDPPLCVQFSQSLHATVITNSKKVELPK